MRYIIPAIVAALIGGYMLARPDAARPKQAAAETAQRIKDWATVTRTKAISPTEELSLVVVPSEFGRPFDVRCLVYKNREFGAVTFTCPDAKQDQLEEGPAP